MQTLDPGTEGGRRALKGLETEPTGWLTTVSPDGQPQSSPIWFLWQDGQILVYSHKRAPRNANIEANHRVAFNLDSDPDGEDSLTMEGTARIDLSLPPSSNDPAYQAKYGHRIARNGWTPEWLAENYPIPIVIAPTRWRLV